MEENVKKSSSLTRDCVR